MHATSATAAAGLLSFDFVCPPSNAHVCWHAMPLQPHLLGYSLLLRLGECVPDAHACWHSCSSKLCQQAPATPRTRGAMLCFDRVSKSPLEAIMHAYANTAIIRD